MPGVACRGGLEGYGSSSATYESVWRAATPWHCEQSNRPVRHKNGRTFRVPLADASVTTEVGCLWVQVSAYPQRKHCDAKRCVWDISLNVDVSDYDAELDGVLSVRECDQKQCEYRRSLDPSTRIGFDSPPGTIG